DEAAQPVAQVSDGGVVDLGDTGERGVGVVEAGRGDEDGFVVHGGPFLCCTPGRGSERSYRMRMTAAIGVRQSALAAGAAVAVAILVRRTRRDDFALLVEQVVQPVSVAVGLGAQVVAVVRG